MACMLAGIDSVTPRRRIHGSHRRRMRRAVFHGSRHSTCIVRLRRGWYRWRVRGEARHVHVAVA